MGEARVWVGGLPTGIEEEEIQKEFERYGEVEKVDVKSSTRDVFAFVKFNKTSDAEYAIEKLDQQQAFGVKIVVRMSQSSGPKSRQQRQDRSRDRSPRRSPPRRSPPRRSPPPRRGDSRDRDRSRGGGAGRGGSRDVRDRDDSRRDDRRDDRSRSRGRDDDRHGRNRSRSRVRSYGDDKGKGKGKGGTVPKGGYKITVENLPDDMSWHELKDLGRNYGDSVTFSRTFRKGSAFCGLIEFKEKEDADKAVRELDRRLIEGCRDKLRAFHGDDRDGSTRRD